MFAIFRKKRIDRYTEGANGYVTRTYAPEPPPKKEPAVKYSLRKADPDIKYSERGDVRYSISDTDDILVMLHYQNGISLISKAL